jgi:hypothetical protein
MLSRFLHPSDRAGEVIVRRRPRCHLYQAKPDPL